MRALFNRVAGQEKKYSLRIELDINEAFEGERPKGRLTGDFFVHGFEEEPIAKVEIVLYQTIRLITDGDRGIFPSSIGSTTTIMVPTQIMLEEISKGREIEGGPDHYRIRIVPSGQPLPIKQRPRTAAGSF
ncbi:MAG: hypothetical protein HYS32_00060 [Candidatus Woesearchaeota archaeon]|nr:MAG: hypothetical protein HYS32_00060 [Candidatus Woesearchaeota archaeon]